jgi:Family of unknown function (DUF6292)
MKPGCTPQRHPDPWVDLIRGYISTAVRSLSDAGLEVRRSWLDPRDPRDATITFADPASSGPASELAVVWDEVTGWRHGVFESGQQGVRTALTRVAYLGGGILPDGLELARRVLSGASESPVQHRSAVSLNDGLDDLLGSFRQTAQARQ